MNPNYDPQIPCVENIMAQAVPRSWSDECCHWLKKLLVCNPFFLVSAALLLYGLAHAPDGKAFFEDHRLQLDFNFLSLQAYECLIVVAAIALSRRRVWYDSTLLAFLEAGFLMVPFILMSQAGFLGNQALWLVGGVGAFAAITRLYALKRFFKELNFSGRLLAIAIALILANLALPLVLRSIHQRHEADIPWFYEMGWFFILPCLALSGAILPFSSSSLLFPLEGAVPPAPKQPPSTDLGAGGTTPSKSQRGMGEYSGVTKKCEAKAAWIPFAFVIIWLIASASHLWTIGYVYDQTWSMGLLLPLASVLSWVVRLRIRDFVLEPSRRLRDCLSFVPFVLAITGILADRREVLAAVVLLNTIGYSFLFLRDRSSEFLRQMVILSLGLFVGSVPLGVFGDPFVHREAQFVGGLALVLVLEALVSPQPGTTFFGAVGILLFSGFFTESWHHPAVVSFQNAFLFAIAHSLFWGQMSLRRRMLMRSLLCAGWLWASCYGLMETAREPSWILLGYGATVVGFFTSWRYLRGQWLMVMAPIAGGILSSAAAIRLFFQEIPNIPMGMAAVIASFILFAMGVLVAWNKERWNLQR